MLSTTSARFFKLDDADPREGGNTKRVSFSVERVEKARGAYWQEEITITCSWAETYNFARMWDMLISGRCAWRTEREATVRRHSPARMATTQLMRDMMKTRDVLARGIY